MFIRKNRPPSPDPGPTNESWLDQNKEKKTQKQEKKNTTYETKLKYLSNYKLYGIQNIKHKCTRGRRNVR